ncbi:MAG: phospholipase D-like domain-containing protein, partial [Saprospiraceae bacterium]
MIRFFFHLRNSLAVIAFLLIFLPEIFAQQSISEIRALPEGSVVTTKGIITSEPEWGTIRYIQDADAGIAMYSISLSNTAHGDSILLTGVLSYYRGQLQISPVLSFQILASGIPIPDPKVKLLDAQNLSLYESMVVSVPCAGIHTCESTFESGWYMMFDDQGRTIRLVIEKNHHLEDTGIPDFPVSLTGIWTKIDEQYQLILQEFQNPASENCIVIPPARIWYFYNDMHLHWEVQDEYDSWAEYGINNFDQTQRVYVTNHEVRYKPQNLIHGEIYQGRFRQHTPVGDTIYSPLTYFVKNGDASDIEILFNRQIDTTFSDGSYPIAIGPAVIETDIISRIDQVDSTLDITMYNSSRRSITDAINRAVQRGVTVRYIADDGTSNSALEEPLLFPVLYRTGEGIMHNKFIVGDADDSAQAWVWSGSTNFSTNQLSSDPNHAIIFHDQGMAINYRKEFDELWGQDLNHDGSRYGSGKTDNTVHGFLLGSTEIESYFSPSDETSCHILEAIKSASEHMEIALLLMTKGDLVDALIERHERFVDIRVIVEDEESSSLALSRLRQAGIKTAVHEFGNIFHHKYAIIDEGILNSNPIVITG